MMSDIMGETLIIIVETFKSSFETVPTHGHRSVWLQAVSR